MAKKEFSIYDMEQVTNEELLAVAQRTESEEVIEAYDPEYVSNQSYEIPDIDDYEKRFSRKVSIVANKLHKAHIRYQWMDNEEMFRVWKYRQDSKGNISQYPTYQYVAVYMETNEYAFGGWEEDRIVSSKISDVIECVKEWLSNNEAGLK